MYKSLKICTGWKNKSSLTQQFQQGLVTFCVKGNNVTFKVKLKVNYSSEVKSAKIIYLGIYR